MTIYREMCISIIHGAIVTQADLYFEGSITIDEELLDVAEILPYEKYGIVLRSRSGTNG